MPFVWNIESVLFSLQLIPIQIQRVKWPIAIVSAIDNQFGNSQILPISKRVDYGLQISAFGSIHPQQEAKFQIVVNLFGEFSPCGELMGDVLCHIERIDHRWGSTAARSQVVHPRLEPPVTVNDMTSMDHSFRHTSCVESKALKELFTIGMSSGQLVSKVFR